MDESSESKEGEVACEVSVLKDVPSEATENVSKKLAFNDGEDPKVGMVFKSYDDIFRFYKEYGNRKGFGVVIKRSWFRKGKCRRADLSCWKSGSGSNSQQSSLTKTTTKTNCPAMVTVRNWKDDLLFVTDVVLEHNHLLCPSRARYFRCNRKLPAAMGKRLDCNDEASVDLDSNKLFLQQNGGSENEYKNYVEKKGTLNLEEGDVIAICDFFLHMQRKNPDFFYLLDWDEEGYLKNLFWADAKSRAAFHYFGDIITFDTSYLINKYDTPIATFVGVNHHGQTVLFGCGLVASETFENYVWLFEAWLSCMSGCPPKAIITDQSVAVQHAVSEIFPESRHRFCLWHIIKKMPEILGHIEQYKAVKKEVKRIVYDSMKISDFEDRWKKMIEDFGLERHNLLDELYDSRHFWVPVFLKNSFWGGMSATQRNQSMNSLFDEYVNSKTSLRQFVSLYEMALQDSYEKEAQADFESSHENRCLFTQFPMEETLSKLYTLNMFMKFQEELKATMNCSISILKVDGSITYFEVREFEFQKGSTIGKTRGFEVSYSACGYEIECICQGFNFKGIVCRHILSVLKFCQQYNLPSTFILDRWRKDFKRIHALARSSDNIVVANELERYDFLTKRSLQVIELTTSSDSNFQLVMKLLDKIERISR